MKSKQTIIIDYEKLQRELEVEVRKRVHYREWLPEEDRLIKKFYGKIPAKIIARKLRRSVTQIYARAERFELRSNLSYLGAQNSPNYLRRIAKA